MTVKFSLCSFMCLRYKLKFRMLQEWELKESIIRSIAWAEPDRKTVFNLSTFKIDVESATSKQEVFNSEL